MSKRVLYLVIAVLATGCMINPGDGKRIASTNTAVAFSGYHDEAGKGIYIQAWNPATSAYQNIGQTTASSTPVSMFGQTWYSWSVSLVIPAWAWQNATSGNGKFARVLSREYGDVNLHSFRADDNVSCLFGAEDLLDLFNDCLTHRSPDTYVYTNDYEHGSANCSSGPSVAKTNYGLSEIPACKRTDIANIMKPRIDHDLVYLHGEMSYIHHEMATGDNGFFKGHRRYLREMEKRLMVYGEKWTPKGALPFYDPTTTIPAAFTAIAFNAQNCNTHTTWDVPNPACNTGWFQQALGDTTPTLPLPPALAPANLCASNGSVTTLHSNVNGLNNSSDQGGPNTWHNALHNRVGGSMASIDSPAALIFWPWHKYIDDIYGTWLECPGMSDP